MIVSFSDSATEALFHGELGPSVKRIPSTLIKAAVRKLDMLNSAGRLEDLRALPGNRFERLEGDLRGMHSIRINDQWRVVFLWVDDDAWDVRIVDYHR